MCARTCTQSAPMCAHMIRVYVPIPDIFTCISFQSTSTSVMRLEDVLLVGRRIRGVTNQGFYAEKKFLSSSAEEQPHTSPQLRRGRGLCKLTIWGIYMLVETLPLCREGSVNVRTLETNKITALCTWSRSDGKRDTISGVDAISPLVFTLETSILKNKDVCDDLCGCLWRMDSASVISSIATSRR